MAMIGGYPPWTRTLAIIRDECGGVFALLPVAASDLDEIVADAAAGTPFARLTVAALVNSTTWISEPDADTPALDCLACNKPLPGRDWMYSVVFPDVPQPGIAVALPVCTGCAPTSEDVNPALMPYLRRMWPALRALPTVSTNGGRA